jgi:hypothetical protein
MNGRIVEILSWVIRLMCAGGEPATLFGVRIARHVRGDIGR